MTESCENCRFLKDNGKHMDQCRRYPPTVVTMDGEQSEYFPYISHGDWCGEWQALAVNRRSEDPPAKDGQKDEDQEGAT